MSILLVEDDSLQAGEIQKQLRRRFHGIVVDVISTEHAFRDAFETIACRPPKVVVMDLMLRWTSPHPEMPERPPDVRAEGPSRAGMRCIDMLAQDPRTSGVPILLYTVLARTDLEAQFLSGHLAVSYVLKSSDVHELVERIGIALSE